MGRRLLSSNKRPPAVQCLLKYCTSRSCCLACSSVAKVPRLRRLPVEVSFLREYKRNWPDLSLRIMQRLDAAPRGEVASRRAIPSSMRASSGGSCRQLDAAFVPDLENLLSGNDVGLDACLRGREPAFNIDQPLVLVRVHLKPAPAQALADAEPHQGCVFTDAAPEDQRIGAPQSGKITAHRPEKAIAEHIHRQAHAGVPFIVAHEHPG